MPGAREEARGSGAVTRHRVVAALGSAPEARSASLRHRRITKAGTPGLLGRELEGAATV